MFDLIKSNKRKKDFFGIWRWEVTLKELIGLSDTSRSFKKKKFTTYHFAKTDADVGIRRKITRLNILRIFILRERAMGGIVIWTSPVAHQTEISWNWKVNNDAPTLM